MTGSQSLTSANNVTWTLGGLSGLTAGSGAYMLTLTAAGSGIVDGVGNPLAANAWDTWTTDAEAATVDIVDVAPDPRNSAVGQLTIVFSKPISGLDLSELSLTRNGGGNLLTGSQSLTSANNVTWTLGGLSGLTAGSGAYMLTLTAAGSGIVDGVGNPLAANASDTWTTNAQPPTVDIVDVAPPTRGTRRSGSLRSSREAISGLDLGDLSLTRNGGGNLLTGSQSLTSADNITWTLGGLSGLTAASGAYTLTRPPPRALSTA